MRFTWWIKYREHLPLIEREIERVGRGLQLDFPAVIGALARQGSREADAACVVFARTLDWPEVSDAVRIELCFRLECTRWWLGINGDEDSDGETGAHMLESLLVEYWRDVGRVDWIHDRFVKNWAEEHFPGSTG